MNAAVLKTVVGLNPPGVRIPPSPLKIVKIFNGEVSPASSKLYKILMGEVDSPMVHLFNMYYIYILLNETKTRTYIGVAEDVNKRLAMHNAGRVKSSSPYRPYKVIHKESFETLKEARQKEKFYKSTTGRRRLKKMISTNKPSRILS